jgi:type IV pilus assembly protein PilV
MTSPYNNAARKLRWDAGFSLLEVMVALVVMSVGLLGIAKMQALALSSTSTARMRSLAALEAASIASTMRADRAYWSNVSNDPNVQITGSGSSTVNPTVTPGDATLISPTSLAVCPCTPAGIAAWDLNGWAADLNKQIPSFQASVNCTVPTPTAPPAPVGCKVVINWIENQVASNAQQAVQIAAQQAQAGGALPRTSYTLYVDP